MTGSATAAELAALRHLARQCGVQTAHVDGTGQRQIPAPDTVMAVLRSLGVEIDHIASASEHSRRIADVEAKQMCEPVVVSWTDRTPLLPIRATARSDGEIELEWVAGPDGFGAQRIAIKDCAASFTTRRDRIVHVPLRWALKPGVYTLHVRFGAREQRVTLLRAARRCFRGEHDASPARDLSAFLPLYAAHRDNGWGIGDLSDLAQLMAWAGANGCTYFGTLPLLACFLDRPFEPSPYAPVSRQVFGEMFIDLDRAIADANCAEVQRLLQSNALQRELAEARSGKLVNYAAVWRIKRTVLMALAEAVFENSDRRAEVERFAASHPMIAEYARFRGACAHYGATWPSWPEGARAGTLGENDIDERERQLFLFAQWLLASQFRDLLQTSEPSSCKLYLDLPIGVHAHGFDTWRHQQLFAPGVAVGAPPDMFFRDGQCWGFPPIVPEASRRAGHVCFAESLERHLQLAGALRLDHVAGLHRCYFVPDGMSARDGAYVQQPAEEFYALLSILSHQHQSILIGENLGTVPREVNRALRRHDVLGMEIGQFSLGRDARRGLPVLEDVSLAALNTHDMPPFAAFWSGEDLDLHAQLGLLDEHAAIAQRLERENERRRTCDALIALGELDLHTEDTAAVLRALIRYLAASPADVVLINLEDLWLETQPQNVPGIGEKYPSWRRRAARSVSEIVCDSELASFIFSLSDLRRAQGAIREPTG